MPSKIFTASTVAQDVFTCPQNKVQYISQILIDSVKDLTYDITLTLQDSFTPDDTANVTGAAVTPDKAVLTATKMNSAQLPDGINNIKILNTAQITCSDTSTDTNITVIWE